MGMYLVTTLDLSVVTISLHSVKIEDNIEMYVSELKAYYPRQVAHIQRSNTNEFNYLLSKSPSVSEDASRKSEKTVFYQKCSKILLGPLNFFYLFMETSSIHGFNHLTTKKRHLFEYILWLGALIGGIYGFLTISLSTLSRYHYNPTVVSLERNYKEWNTTLPAATVCPNEKYDETNLENLFSNQLKRINDKNALQEFLEKLAKSNYSSFDSLANFEDILPTEYLDAIVNMRYDFDYSVSNSNIETEDLQEQKMVMNLNEISICYSYNSQVAIYLNPLSWKSGNYTDSSTTFSIVGSPLDGDIFTQVTNMATGYTVYLHSPQEVPDIATKGSWADEGSYKTQDVVAVSIVSSPEIRDLTIPQRRCRFPEESDLTISPIYSYNLCRMECRMKLSFKLCNCIPYFYKPSGKYKVCDIKGMQCLTKHSEVLIKLVDEGKRIECNCLPPCDDVNFVIETENNMEWALGTNLKWGLVKYPRERLRRDVLFGIADVLVAMGGTAGLFFGCSVLSLVEIFYFFTLRLLWFLLRKKK